MNVFLIQPGRFEKRERKTGVDALVRFITMGYAEFECGALGDSLETIRKNLKDYDLTEQQVSAYGKQTRYFLFAPKANEEEIIKNINLLALDKINLKSLVYFDTACGSKAWFNSSDPPDLWWDIDNHYIWWLPHELQDAFMDALKNGGA